MARQLDELDLDNLEKAAKRSGMAHPTDIIRLVEEVRRLRKELEPDDGKSEFTFKVWYFKPTGKFYTEVDFVCRASVTGDGVSPYMNNAVDELKKAREEGELPGLQSGKWEGFILLNHSDGFPVLITSEKFA